MSHDRVQTDTMNLTQEFLSEMLGTARPSVTLAAAPCSGKAPSNTFAAQSRCRTARCSSSQRAGV